MEHCAKLVPRFIANLLLTRHKLSEAFRMQRYATAEKVQTWHETL